jgi:NhaP-type Na+/H+ or K+/H+ antiporter
MLASAIIYWSTGETASEFQGNIFFQFMLPFLIFGVGYNMKRRRFFRNIGHIVTNGLLGTLINFVLLSVFAWTFSEIGAIRDRDGDTKYITLRDALAIGGVLSSTDMAISLSVLHENHTPKLHSLIFGESIINTAVAILLVRTVNFAVFDNVTAASVFTFIGYFLYNFITSLLLGTLFGFISCILTKNLTALKNDPSKEVALQFYIAWSGYIVAEMVGISGVMTILICAILTGHYAWYNLTQESRIVVGDTFYLFGDGTQALIFSYLGLTSLSYSGKDISYIFILLMVVAIMASRLVTTFGFAIITKLIKKKKYDFNWKDLSILWFAGNFRGTIAFALMASLEISHAEILKVTVLGLVIFTMLVFGFLMPIWVTLVKPSEVIQQNLSLIEAAIAGDLRRSLVGSGRINFMLTKDDVTKKKSWFHKKWANFDTNYIKPCLIDKEKLEEQKRFKEELEARARAEETGEVIEEKEEGKNPSSINSLPE